MGRYKEWKSNYGPQEDGTLQGKVACVVNPAHATDGSCVEAPLDGDQCDHVFSPSRCRACLERVMLGDAAEIRKHVAGLVGSNVLVIFNLGLFIVPIGILVCENAFPKCCD